MEHYERSYRKKREIEKALLALLLQYPYSQINVTRLAERLGISRKNFYDYFSNIDACLYAMIDHVIMEAAIYATSGGADSADDFQHCIRNLEYWKANAAYLQVIDQNRLEEVLTERFMRYLISEDYQTCEKLQTEKVAADADVLYFFANGIVGLLLRWYRRGFDTPQEELAEKVCRLLRQPLLPNGAGDLSGERDFC